MQADVGGDMLIDDLRVSIAQQAAFDAVVRVRTSTGQSLVVSVGMAYDTYCPLVDYSVLF